MLRRWRPSGVQLLDAVAVALGDDVALDLQGRRELAVGLAEVAVEDREALDLLDAREPLVDRVDRGLQLGADRRVRRERGGVAGRDARRARRA